MKSPTPHLQPLAQYGIVKQICYGSSADMNSAKKILTAHNPLILRFFRLVDAFSKADDERDFYLDRFEGFILFVDLSKSDEDLQRLESELASNPDRYCPIPKLTFYEQKKIMEGFVNEKVYDIDTKEKLQDIISSKNPRQNFLEFLLDHLPELEKWQLFYQERFRIRIIEWLRSYGLTFVFEEDLDLGKTAVEKLKNYQFSDKPPKDVVTSRKKLDLKAKTYYSNEALNPRPKRGRPPKQTVKIEVEPQLSDDIFNQVPSGLHSFLYLPTINTSQEVTFSPVFSTHEDLLASYRSQERATSTIERLEALSQKLATMHNISSHLNSELLKRPDSPITSLDGEDEDEDDWDDEDDSDDEDEENSKPLKAKSAKRKSKPAAKKPPVKKKK